MVIAGEEQIIELRLNKGVLPPGEINYARIMKDSGADWVVYDMSGRRGAPVYLTNFNACVWVVKTRLPGALTFPIETFLNMLREEEVKNDD